MRRTIYVSERLGIQGLRRQEQELAAPGDNEVQVEVRAIGLNFADVFSVLGLYAAAPRRPFTPGIEFSGVIASVGSGVRGYEIGDRVMGVRFFGAYTTALNVDAELVRRIPDDWSFEDGAGHIVATLTAYYGLVDQCRLKRGETVLIQSAAGAVGLAALSIAKKFDCHVIGTVGARSKEDLCRHRGYDAIVVRGREFRKDLERSLAGRELDVIMDSVGGSTFGQSFSYLAPRGRAAVYGFAELMPYSALSYISMVWKYLRRPRIDTMQLNNRMIAGFNLIYLFDKADEIGAYLEEIAALNIGKPYIGATYSFEEIPQALASLRSGKTSGKIIVIV